MIIVTLINSEFEMFLQISIRQLKKDISFYTSALNLRFGETDFSHREDRGSLEAVFEARGQFTGSIVVEVIPMTVSQFLSQGLTPVPPAITNVNLHHAKAGRALLY